MSSSIPVSATTDPQSEPSARVAAPGLWRATWHSLRRNRAALVALALICAVVLVAALAPLLAPYPYARADFGAITQGPSWRHWLGTDELGRDVLSRLMYGARVSFTVAVVAQLVILCIGVPVGLLSGYYGGWFDLIVQRAVEILYAFPSLLFVIVIMTYVKASFQASRGPLAALLSGVNGATGGLIGVFIALGLVFWLTVARLVRAETLVIKQTEYVQAARAIGASDWAIMRRHILPNVLAPITVAVTFGIPSAILTEAGLSFLGLGVDPPTPSWGAMIAEGVQDIASYPHLLLSSGLALSLTLLAFNFLGDGLRMALDPRLRR